MGDGNGKTKQKVNRVMFVVDRSGSMQSIMGRAIVALNDNIRAVRQQVGETGQDATVSLVTFSEDVETRFFNRSLGAVQDLAEGAIRTGGGTALLDAVGSSIEQLRGIPVGEDEDVSYLLVVITDGAENQSREFGGQRGAERLIKLMREVQATDVWTLTFLVPRGGRSELARFGVPDGNVMEWEQTAKGVATAGAASRGGIESFFRARAAGQTSVRSFYADMSGVSAKEVRQLADLSSRATVLEVDRDDNIRDFIERKGLPFVKGAAFYQLVAGKKDADRVQDYKKVLIMENGRTAIHGGDDARQLLGLPDSTTKVRPSDLAGFTVFIQSTSTNRKVLAGTRVIYMPSAAT